MGPGSPGFRFLIALFLLFRGDSIWCLRLLIFIQLDLRVLMDLGDRPRALLAKYLDLLLELLDYGVLLLGDVVSVPLEKFDLLLVLDSNIGLLLRADVSLTY